MIQITINNKSHQLGAPLPEHIFEASFTTAPTISFVRIAPDQATFLKQWFNQFIDRCTCEWVLVNNTYCRVDELTKFEGL